MVGQSNPERSTNDINKNLALPGWGAPKTHNYAAREYAYVTCGVCIPTIPGLYKYLINFKWLREDPSEKVPLLRSIYVCNPNLISTNQKTEMLVFSKKSTNTNAAKSKICQTHCPDHTSP